MPGDFREYQEVRDTGTVLLLLGIPSLVFSIGFFFWSCYLGEPLAWFDWFLGPISLLVSGIFLPIGVVSAKKAKRLKESIDQ